MDTLYRFRLNDDGTIETQVIEEYEEWRDRYRWRGKSCTCWVKRKNLNKMFVNAVYSFDPDKERAKLIMIQSLKSKAEECMKEYNKRMDMIHEIFNNN